MIIKAKVAVTSNTPTEFDGVKYAENVQMRAVYSDSLENKTFSEATPSGVIELTITNKAAWGFFTEGKEFYVDFTPADAPEE